MIGDKTMEKRTMFIHNTKEETDTLSLRIPILKEYIDNKNVKK